mmetsp:Transcript_14159/g.29891  ORF Transcript_14159/g.29891 Transcript_14159/m.29891 type:complete len:205 (+) Transcript_14159:549-1163(+)
MGGQLNAERRRPLHDVVVQLRKQLDEVEPVSDEVESELSEMILGEQENGATVEVVVLEGRHQLPKPERLEPARELLAVPQQRVARQAEHLEVWQPSDGGEACGDRLAVEVKLVQVLVAPVDKATEHLEARRALASRALSACVLLLAAELHAEVGLPDARALQLEVVRVLVTPLAPAALHLHPRHVHLGRALPRLVLELTLEEKA